MTTTRNNDQSLELLLENLIRMQGKLNEKVDHLHSRINQLEYALRQLPQQEQTITNALLV
jgi:prefoldin subunit 5